MATQPVQPQPQMDDDALARQFGAVQSQTPSAPAPQTSLVSAPAQPNQAPPTDDDALARQFGAVNPSPEPSEPGTPEEHAFLQKNPSYVYVKADPKFPNRQEGIYHKNESGLNDPEMEHHPVDLHFAEHTAEGAGTAAAAIGLTTGLAAATPEVAALSAKLPQVVEYMSHLDNIMKMAKTMSWVGFGLKEAADVYKAVKEMTK